MSAYQIGESTLYCHYLFSKPLINKASELDIKLSRQIREHDYDEKLVTFVCENVIHDWDGVRDPDDKLLEFDASLLYDVFNNHPELFINVLRFASRIDNFKVVNNDG